MSVFVFVIIIVALAMCGEVASKWLQRGAPRHELDSGGDEEVLRLRAAVEQLSDQVNRLSEEQRFITRLLEGRSPSIQAPSESRSGSTPDPRPQEPT